MRKERAALTGYLVSNARSLVNLDNLVDLLMCCIDHPAAAGQTFLVSDGEDLSTPDLIRRLSLMMGKSPMLLPVPIFLLHLVGQLTGKRIDVERLVSSLQIDSSHTSNTLDWMPPFSVDEGLKKTADWYLARKKLK